MKTLFTSKNLKKIPYMDKPPALGGKLSYLTPEEFEKKFGCAYFEGVKTVDNKYAAIAESVIASNPLLKALNTYLLNPPECLVIADMGKVGHGLFTIADIAKGAVLCVYAGEYKLNDEEMAYSYANVNARKIGGVSRFMQHLPLPSETYCTYRCHTCNDSVLYALSNETTLEKAQEELKKGVAIQKMVQKSYKEGKAEGAFNFDDIKFLKKEVKESCATSNVACEKLRVNGVELIIMVAMRDIKKNEIVGFSYGNAYWHYKTINQRPFLFDRKGEIIQATGNYQYPPLSQYEKILRSMQNLGPDFPNLEADNKEIKLEPASYKLTRRIPYTSIFSTTLLPKIASFTSGVEVSRFKLVSKDWQRFTQDEMLWKSYVLQELTAYPRLLPHQTYKSYYRDGYQGISTELNMRDGDSYKGYWQHGTKHSSGRLGEAKSAEQKYSASQAILGSYLLTACRRGYEVWAIKLIRQGADINLWQGRPLKCAIESGNSYLIEWLVANGAELNFKRTYQFSSEDVSIFHYAAYSPNAKLAFQYLFQEDEKITILPELHKAAAKGDFVKLTKLLKEGAQVNQPDIGKCTALWWAIVAGQATCVQILLAKKASLTAIAGGNYRYGNYTSALMTAIWRKEKLCLQVILEAKPNIQEIVKHEYKPVPLTAVHKAVEYDFVEGLILLAEQDARIDFADRNKFTPLHAAAKAGSRACVAWLIQQKVEVDTLGTWIEIDEDGKDDYMYAMTPLGLAAQYGHTTCLELLLAAKANPNIKQHKMHKHHPRGGESITQDEGYSILPAFINNLPSSLSRSNALKMELMHADFNPEDSRYAISHNYVKGLRLLLQHGADTNSLGINGETALAILLNDYYQNYKMASYEKLIESCAKALIAFKANVDQAYALHKAISMGYSSLVKLFVEKGHANTNLCNKWGDTPLIIAAQHGQAEIFQYLIERGADLNKTNQTGETALIVAKKRNQLNILTLIENLTDGVQDVKQDQLKLRL